MDLNSVTAVLSGRDFTPADWQPGDAWLAGGTWLFSEPQPAIRRLIDLTACQWPALSAGEGGLEISATCTLAELARYPGRREWPATVLLARCCEALLGSFKIWHTATVGGNLCLALPAGPMTSLCAALDGVCTVWERGGGVSRVAAAEFVRGPGENILAPGALLRSVLLPATTLRARTAFRQLSLTPLGRSAVLVIGRQDPGGDVVITLTAAVRRPLQLRFGALPSSEALRAAIADAGPEYHDDVHGHPQWREHLAGRLAEEVRAELAGGS